MPNIFELGEKFSPWQYQKPKLAPNTCIYIIFLKLLKIESEHFFRLHCICQFIIVCKFAYAPHYQESVNH